MRAAVLFCHPRESVMAGLVPAIHAVTGRGGFRTST
jgi:hypothetical protein